LGLGIDAEAAIRRHIACHNVDAANAGHGVDAVAAGCNIPRPVLAFHHDGNSADTGEDIVVEKAESLDLRIDAVAAGIDAPGDNGDTVDGAAENGLEPEILQVESGSGCRIDASFGRR